jgi:hypothetical protein
MNMRVISKIELLEQTAEGNSDIRLEALRVDKELWSPIEAMSSKVTVEDLLETAAENIVKYRVSEKVLLVSVETPGLRVILGDNSLKKTSTILSPKPSYLRRVLFVKCRDGGNCGVIYEFRPSRQLVVYEGAIELLKSIDYDFIILECDDYKRILFPHELSMPAVKSEVKKTKRRRRRHVKSKRSRKRKEKTKKPGSKKSRRSKR